MVTVGVGVPLEVICEGENSTTVAPLKFETHKFPLSSKPIPTGTMRLPSLAPMVTAGVGLPVVLSEEAASSTTVLLAAFAAQRL